MRIHGLGIPKGSFFPLNYRGKGRSMVTRESPKEAALREFTEETGIHSDLKLIDLDKPNNNTYIYCTVLSDKNIEEFHNAVRSNTIDLEVSQIGFVHIDDLNKIKLNKLTESYLKSSSITCSKNRVYLLRP